MKWFLIALLILLAALALQSGLLAYAMYVLLGLLLFSRVLAQRWTEQLSATRVCRVVGRTQEEESPSLIAEVGDRVAVRVTLRNDGSLPVPWVLVEDALPRHALSAMFQRLRVRGKRLHLGMIRSGATTELRYQVECLARGYYPIGPAIVESGDLFGLHRRYRVATEPRYLLVLPKVVPLEDYDLTSRRPIGDIRMSHRLYEDPTRIAGVRRYEPGDPLNRLHWKATARTGVLHSKLHEPSTLAGATILLDFHRDGFHERGEPYRSELAVTTVASLANALCEEGQQVGFVTNARNAAERIRRASAARDPRTRQEAQQLADDEQRSRMDPMIVPTRRGVEQLQRIREVLALAELNDGLSFAGLITETAGRIPRDATVIAVLSAVPVKSALALGNLRRQGLAISAILIIMADSALEKAHARLLAEGINDIRHLTEESALPFLCSQQLSHASPYVMR
jgi:uncharacterized protein (DUF58 family)